MSHELRTPLHTIIGFSELLAEQLEGPLTEKQSRFIGHILQDARHLLGLINEILDISKIESGRLELKYEEFDLTQCIEEVLAGVRNHAAGKNIKLENKSSFQGNFYADRLRIKEVLYNLMSNAVKFTLEGGQVWVESDQVDDFVTISICDTGIGVPNDEQSSIFDKFYQVKGAAGRSHEGTGLGLPIARQLVELHGGEIRLESSHGHGSKFKVKLPRKRPQSA